MSNPKGQHLESVFPLPWGIGCFSWAMQTTVRAYLYLHICGYLRARRAESRQSRGARGRARRQRPKDGSPCPTEFMTSVNWTSVSQMENWSTRDRVTSRNWPRKLARDRTRRPSSEELSSPRSLERTPSQTPCLPPEGSAFDQNSSGLVKAQMRVPEQPLHHVSVTEGGQRCAATDGAVPSAGRSGAGAGSDAERPEENLLLSLLLSCSCSFYSPLWLYQAAWITINGYAPALSGTA